MEFAFVPYTDALLDNRLFERNQYDITNPYGTDFPAFRDLRRKLESDGHRVTTIDVVELPDVDVCVFIDINYHLLRQVKRMADPPKVVYLMRESPAFVPFNTAPHVKRYLNLFDAVLTWNPEIADYNSKCHEYRLPYFYPEYAFGTTAFEDRSLLCNISGRKYSNHPSELYSTREDIVHYFDANHPREFSLYGIGWDSGVGILNYGKHGSFRPSTYRTYRGLVDSKDAVYSEYKFALAFENVMGVEGYITEKIFDCLRFGIVPVYQGCSNVETYIPDSLYIDYREIDGPSELFETLQHFDEEQYREFVVESKAFLEGNTARMFTADGYVDAVSDVLLDVEYDSVARIPDRLEREVDHLASKDRLTYDRAGTSRAKTLVDIVDEFRRHPKLFVSDPYLLYHALR